MIVIPAILITLVEAAVIGGLAGAVICGMEDRRTLPPDAPKELRTAHRCAAEGALLSGTISLAFPFFGVFDDLGRPVASVGDDAVGFADDAAKLARGGAGQVARSLTRHLNAPLKLEANVSRASYYRWLRMPKGASGYVYVVEDIANVGRYKIGRTIEPARRLREISSRVGNKVKFVCIIHTNYMRILEHALHLAFAPQRLPNIGAGTEWFSLSRLQVAAACSL